MSVNYAAGLSPYDNKGVCGLPELFDAADVLESKIAQLHQWLIESSHCVVHTGAGISTACGIPDFRGPTGVWTLENEGKAPKFDVTFDEAVPSFTHRAICAMEKQQIIKYVITQNVDGLHLRSGYPRDRLSILHGDMFVNRCEMCNREQFNTTASRTIGQKLTGRGCGRPKPNGARGSCRGQLRDSILDWEDCLPYPDIEHAEMHSRTADLSICLGTSLRICPAGDFPTWTKKRGGKLVIVNLQKTKQHTKADLVIHARVDEVMQRLCARLELMVPKYEAPSLVLSSDHPVDISLLKLAASSAKSQSNSVRRKRRGDSNIVGEESTVSEAKVIRPSDVQQQQQQQQQQPIQQQQQELGCASTISNNHEKACANVQLVDLKPDVKPDVLSVDSCGVIQELLTDVVDRVTGSLVLDDSFDSVKTS